MEAPVAINIAVNLRAYEMLKGGPFSFYSRRHARNRMRVSSNLVFDEFVIFFLFFSEALALI